MAIQKELDNEGFHLEGQVTQAMIDQHLNQIRAEQDGQGLTAGKLAKTQAEMFVKSNLDYENRLRGHMYQFEEDGGHGGNEIHAPPSEGHSPAQMMSTAQDEVK